MKTKRQRIEVEVSHRELTGAYEEATEEEAIRECQLRRLEGTLEWYWRKGIL